MIRALPLLLLSTSGWAQDDEAALRALEAAMAADRAAAPAPAPAARQPGGSGGYLDMALILDVAGGWFSQEGQQVGAHDPQDTGFTLQQLEWHSAANVDHVFRIEANVVFALFGVEVEEVFATSLALPGGLQARAGAFLTRFGRLNPSHPHAWAFLDQPLVSGKFFGGEGSRGLGVEASWLTPLPWYVELVFSATSASGACCARSFHGAEDPRVESAGDLLYTTALKQFYDLSPAWGLQWGMSAQFGPNASGQDNRSEIYGTDLYLRYRPPASTRRTAVSLQVEAMNRRRQQPNDVLVDSGGYAHLVWNIVPEWAVGARYEFVEGLEDDPLDPDWDQARQRAATQLTYYPSHFSRLRLQGSRDDVPGLDDPIWSVVLGLEVLAGAHGAHGY